MVLNLYAEISRKKRVPGSAQRHSGNGEEIRGCELPDHVVYCAN
jgi:hypothetical protein